MAQRSEAGPLRVRTSSIIALLAGGAALLSSLVPGMVFIGLALAVVSLLVATFRTPVVGHGIDKIALALAGSAVLIAVVWGFLAWPVDMFPEETKIVPEEEALRGG